MLSEFIDTVYLLALNGKWKELRRYLSFIGDILDQPRAVLTPGIPQNKDKNK